MKRLLHIAYSAKSKSGSFTASILLLLISINMSGQKLQSVLSETWTDGSWLYSSKSDNTYNGSNYLIKNLLLSWDDITDNWLNAYQIDYTNNSNGTVNQSIAQSWGVDSWENVQRATNTYDGSGRMLTTISEIWIGADWNYQSNTLRTYDVNGYLIHNLSQNWDFIGDDWKNSSQLIYTNNPDGTPGQFVLQLWDGSSGDWINSGRFTYTYNTAGKIFTTLGEAWVAPGVWQNLSFMTNTYDINGYLTSELNQDWNIPSGWINDTKTDFTNDTDGRVIQNITLQWETTPGTWINSMRETFTYSGTTALPDFKDDKTFRVYPNPADEIITIRTESENSSIAYSLEDQTGKQVLNGRLNGMLTTLNISGLNKGIYFLRLYDNRQSIIKIIKK